MCADIDRKEINFDGIGRGGGERKITEGWHELRHDGDGCGFAAERMKVAVLVWKFSVLLLGRFFWLLPFDFLECPLKLHI